MPNLCRAASSAVSAYTVAEVVGQLGSPSLSSIINTACASAGKAVEVTEIELRHLPALRTGLGEKEVDERRGILADNGMAQLIHPLINVFVCFPGDVC